MALTWDELPRVIANRKVRIQVRNQPVVRGQVIGVEQREIQVRKGKMVARIARDEVVSIELTRYEGRARRVGLRTGIGVGLVAGLIVLAAIGLDETSGDTKAENTAKAVGGWVGTWAGAAIGGYLIGQWVDREDVTITVMQ
jgi:hypothetical protein